VATAAKDGRSRLESGRWRSAARWLPDRHVAAHHAREPAPAFVRAAIARRGSGAGGPQLILRHAPFRCCSQIFHTKSKRALAVKMTRRLPGRRTVKTEPLPGPLVRESAWVNSWKSFACCSAVKPMPVSATASSTQSRPTATLRTPQGGPPGGERARPPPSRAGPVPPRRSGIHRRCSGLRRSRVRAMPADRPATSAHRRGCQCAGFSPTAAPADASPWTTKQPTDPIVRLA
jgi:hypothetical protein